jgi:hypothetical protein
MEDRKDNFLMVPILGTCPSYFQKKGNAWCCPKGIGAKGEENRKRSPILFGTSTRDEDSDEDEYP